MFSARIKLLLILVILLQSCNNEKKHAFEGEFYGLWADTMWFYKFTRNNLFYFKTEGHFGLTHCAGYYKLQHDTIFLFPDSSIEINIEIRPSSEFYTHSETLVIEEDTCIYDLTTRYEYCKIGTEKVKIIDGELVIYHSRERM